MTKTERSCITLLGAFTLIGTVLYLFYLVTCEEIPHIWNVTVFSTLAPVMLFEFLVSISKEEKNQHETDDETFFHSIGCVLILLISFICAFGTFGIIILYAESKILCLKLAIFVALNWLGITFCYMSRLYKATELIRKKLKGE